MRIFYIFLLCMQLSFSFEKVAFIAGTGAISLSSNSNVLDLGYANIGASIYYPWFDTNFISGALIDMMVYEPSDPQAYDPTVTKTPHDLGIITTIGFNFGYLFDNDISLYGGLKYSTNQISGVSGDGFAISTNIEYDLSDEFGIGLAYKVGTLYMHLANKSESYTATGVYLTIRQEGR